MKVVNLLFYTFLSFILPICIVNAQNCPAPADFNHITPCYVNGSRTASPNEDVIVLFNHTSSRGTSATKQVLADYAEVGTVWGMAYKPQTKKLYAAAFLKRHCDLSPDGLGAIYEIDVTTPTTAGAGAPTLWMNLNTITHLGAGATLFPSETAANRGLNGLLDPSHDIWAFSRVGKEGLGDIEISEDGSSMYVMDLTNRQVLEINMTTKVVTNRYAVNTPSGYPNANDRRPFAIKHHDGQLYIGVVSSGESSYSSTDAYANRIALRGTVMRLSGTSFTTVYNIDSLGVEDSAFPGNTCRYTSYRGNPCFGTGLGWNGYFTTDIAPLFDLNNPSAFIQYPVPLISDIEFDNNDNIVIGIMDWSAHRYGNSNYIPNASNTTNLKSIQAHGDILRAIKSGTSWVKESALGKHYDDMQAIPDPAPSGWPRDTYMGGMLVTDCNGTELVVANMQDPYTTNEGGVVWMRTSDGYMQTSAAPPSSPTASANAINASRLRVYAGTGGTSNTFGKANGLGDMVAMFASQNPCSSSITASPTPCNTTTNQYNVSGQVTFSNPPATGTLTVSISGGSSQVFNPPFNSPVNYTINGQISDGIMRTVTATFSEDNTCASTTAFTAPASCVTPGSCNCKEYIYLNEPQLGAVLKFEVGSPILLTEVIGTNGGTPPFQHWYPGLGTSVLPSPHGLATDLNGRLYIADQGAPTPITIREFNCDGVIMPITPTTIVDNNDYLTSMFSIGNTLYKNAPGKIIAYDMCTGQLIGVKNLAGGSVNSGFLYWGLSYNPVTKTGYATDQVGFVWKFNEIELNDFSTSISPLIAKGTTTSINMGDSFIPSDVSPGGIVGDNAGNFYFTDLSGKVLKYNSQGQFISSISDPVKLQTILGIVWSESTNRLYVSGLTDDPAVDCISAIDPITMTYLGAAAPNPNLPDNNAPKAIAILKECCPINLPSTFQREVCGAIGTKFFLNEEAFNLCDGTVCGSSWTPIDNNNSIMTFDACDNSVVVNGNGCRTFTLNIGAVSSTGCGAQNSTFTICNTVIDATITSNSGTCTGATPNNNASIVISNILNVNQAGISVGTVYNGPAYGTAGTISIIGGGTFPNLVHNTYYTVRIFNGSNDCFFDRVILTPTVQCCNIAAIVPQNLECLDNGTPNKLTDNRIRFSAQVTNTNGLLTGYNVTINGGTTITPYTNVPYGITQFLLGPGTAGGGATFTITVTDSVNPGCNQSFQVVDPGNCTPANPPVDCPPVKCGTATIQVNGN